MRPFVVRTYVTRKNMSNREPVQVHAEVVDAFLNRNNWWAGMRVTSSVERISMRIIFPKEFPFKKGTAIYQIPE